VDGGGGEEEALHWFGHCLGGLLCEALGWWRFGRTFCIMLIAVVRIWKARVVSECIWYTYTLARGNISLKAQATCRKIEDPLFPTIVR
jgi:hypothetical protein